MKKSGFTLAELLIALGIVGVISALLATALLTLQPDQQKAIYLKNYDALSKAVKELAHNDRLFPICQDNLNCQEHPLFNTSSGVGGRFVAIGEGDGKLCRGLSYVFNGQMLPNLNCDNQPLTYEDGDWTPSFRTYRTEWLVSTLRELSGNSATYQSDVYFDLNGPAAPNCVYGDNCKNPDRFKFLVAANGTVIPADPIGQEYIKTRKNWRKSNLNISEDRSTKETLLADLRSFILNPCASESGGNGAGGGGATGGEGDNDGELLYFITRIPCGFEYNGRIINCFSTRFYFNQETNIKYTEVSNYPYPALFNPFTFEFDYPVASNITFDTDITGPFISTTGELGGSGGTYNIFSSKSPMARCTIVQGSMKCTQNYFYEYGKESVPLKYPSNITEILNNIKNNYKMSVGRIMEVRDDNYLTFRGGAGLWFGILNSSLYLPNGDYEPYLDSKYIYLPSNLHNPVYEPFASGMDSDIVDGQKFTHQSQGLMYIAYGYTFDTKVNDTEAAAWHNYWWNLDNAYTIKFRPIIKQAIQKGKNVYVCNGGHYYAQCIQAKKLTLK